MAIFLQNMFLTVIGLSFSGGLLFLLIRFCNKLLEKQLTRSLSYYLWILVLLRMILPFQPEGSIGELLSNNIRTAFLQEDSGSAGQGLRFQTEDTFERRDANIEVGTQGMNSDTIHTDRPAVYSQRANGSLNTSNTPFQYIPNLFVNLLCQFWFAGVMVAVVLKGLQYRSFLRLLKRQSSKVREGDILHLHNKLTSGLMVKPSLYKGQMIESPMLVGLFKPVIVLPERIFKMYDKEAQTMSEVEGILRHEMVHLKRKDLLYKWIVQLVCCIHWFNPAVYALSKVISQDCELSCDERVCKDFSREERLIYGKALLSVITPIEERGIEMFCTLMGSEKKKLKERLNVIKDNRAKKTWEKVLCISLAAAMCCTAVFMGSIRIEALEGSQIIITAEEKFLDELVGSLVVDGNLDIVQFTIPNEVPEHYKIWIHFSGRYFMDDQGGGLSSHRFEEESENFSWVPGKTYETSIHADNLDDYYFSFGLLPKSSSDGGEGDSYVVSMRESGFRVFYPYAYLEREYPKKPYTDWKNAYIDVIGSFTDETISYGFLDVDGDGTPELICSFGLQADSCVYTYKSGDLQYLGDIEGQSKSHKYTVTANAVTKSPADLTLMNNKMEDCYLINGENVLKEDMLNRESEILYSYADVQGDLKNLAITFALWDHGADKDQLEAAGRWAQSYASRDGSVRYNMLSEEKQAVFFEEDHTVVSEKELFEENGFISIRGSSPWVDSYSLEQSDRNKVTITYILTTSAIDYYVMTEILEFGMDDHKMTVTDYLTSEMSELIS